jgi:Leucine-rich repeat (LRR) protein
LKSLNLSKNKIVNVPVELKKLKELKEFDLRGNRIPEEKKGMLKSWFPDCTLQI